jgi:hypothetical protein
MRRFDKQRSISECFVKRSLVTNLTNLEIQCETYHQSPRFRQMEMVQGLLGYMTVGSRLAAEVKLDILGNVYQGMVEEMPYLLISVMEGPARELAITQPKQV